MILKEISTRHKDNHGSPLYMLRDSKNYPAQYWPVMMRYLKRNEAAGLIKLEVVEK